MNQNVISNSSSSLITRKYDLDNLLISLNQNAKRNFFQKFDCVLDGFLEKYSDENLQKVLEKRLNDVKSTHSKHDHTTLDLINIKVLMQKYPNLKNNLVDSSFIEANKIVRSQSNIQYNLSNQSCRNLKNIKSRFDEKQLKIENIRYF